MEDYTPDGEVLAGWQGHPGTQWFAHNIRTKELPNALLDLLGHARQSTDPLVRAAAMRHDILNQVLVSMVPKPEQESEDSFYEG